ncbi:MAG: efflux RND transporter periplasmic adaptor subunit [Deltaproteobacteria bacterium]|nr:efflux RND transporter periplasmic adaptor subunit [Deltaproteobacteria bacterium]MBW2013457.1 efflux RND transporter periplasmic adaptor subunit [Deltaproteobacteria bacterium]MBW2321570.1 efflux RND transporter periplasmic adaptor subunit [Deltaproteobacteria bacterium]
MVKRIIITLIGLIVLIGGLAGIKYLQIERMTAYGDNVVPPPEVVTTATAKNDSWESFLTAVGSLEAVQGVAVTAELKGKVVRIAFEPGTMVETGDLLIEQDTSVESAQLRAAEAEVALAKINFKRSKELVAAKTISQSDFDNADAKFKQAVAQADNIRAIIGKKTIRAPFAGRLGIRQVNLGQTLNEGDEIVSLQSLDPIYVNFLLPQQRLAQVYPGLAIRLTTDAFPGQVVSGKITTINPQVDAATRNIRIQATVANPSELLRPGMYVNVSVVLPDQIEVLTIPATSVLYAPYGDSVFVVEKKKNNANEPSGLVLNQKFVRLGKKRGDYISVVSGLKQGETVVSTGVFKLRNGQAVVIDNTLSPDFKQMPKPADA